MATAPFAPTASCILLPAVSSDRLLQQISGLLRSAGSSGNQDPAATVDGLAQTNHVIQLLLSGILQATDGSLKEVTISNNIPSVFTAPALITIPSDGSGIALTSCSNISSSSSSSSTNTTTTATNTTASTSLTSATGTTPTAATFPIEVINAILRLPEAVLASRSGGTSLRVQKSCSLDPFSLTVRENQAMNPLPTVAPGVSNSDSVLRLKCESPERSDHPLLPTEEAFGQTTPETVCSSSLLLHRLLTGEDANRVRSRSELLLLADEERRRDLNQGLRSGLSSTDDGGDDALERRMTSASNPGSLQVASKNDQQPTTPPLSTSVVVNNSTPVTVGQLLGLLREVCQLIANQKTDSLSQTVNQPVTLNTVILKHILPHLTGTEVKQTVGNSNSTTLSCGTTSVLTTSSTTSSPTSTTQPTLPIKANRVNEMPAHYQTYAAAAVVNNRPSSPPVDCSILGSRLQGLRECDFPTRLMGTEFTRPRCHSDHQPNRPPLLHVNLDQYNHGLYSQQQQKSQYQFQQQQNYQQRRPRSYSKAERRCHSRLRTGLLDARIGSSTGCDPNSSLLAKLVLTPESSWGNATTASSNSSSPNPDVPTPAPSSGESLIKAVDDGSLSSGSSLQLPPVIGRRHQPTTFYRCTSADCQRVFHWLRETDEFVTQHCTGIPRNASVLTATAARSSALGREMRAMLDKIWHQLLLICMVENKFSFSVAPLEYATACHQETAVSLKLPPSNDDSQSLHLDFSNDIANSGAQKNGVTEGYPIEGDGDVVPRVDDTFIRQLRAVIATSVDLSLQPEIYRLIRLSILAQAAYPDYYPHSYTNQMADLESHLTVLSGTGEKETGTSRLVGTLRLLNQLHSIDATRLQCFFGLSTVPSTRMYQEEGSAPLKRSEDRDQVLHNSLKPDPEAKSGGHSRSNTSSPSTTSTITSVPVTTSSGTSSGVLVGASKRKATAVSRRRFGSITEDVSRLFPVTTTTTSSLEPTFRCRANTISGDSGTSGSSHVRHCKTARMS